MLELRVGKTDENIWEEKKRAKDLIKKVIVVFFLKKETDEWIIE